MDQASTPRTAARPGRGSRLAVVAAGCAAGAATGHWLSIEVAGQTLPALWVPAGILAGALIVSPGREWALLVATAAAGTLAASPLTPGAPDAAGVALGLVYLIEALTVVWLLRRRVEPFALDRAPDTGVFVAAAVVVPLLGGAVVLPTAGGSPLAAWGVAWLAGTIGLVSTAPIYIWAVRSGRQPGRSASAALEQIGLLVGVVLVSNFVFGDAVPNAVRAPAYVLPFLLWAAFRTGPGGVAMTMLALDFVGIYHTSMGQGPFTVTGLDLPASAAVFRSQGVAAAVGISMLLLATIIAERKRVAEERDLVVAELRAALAEIKTLQGMIPICAWCHKIRDDAGFWQGIESYVDAHTNATLSHGICPDCSDRLRASVNEPHEVGAG